ncbi:hypothetical protein ADJ79_04900 [Ottowia sp. oral taxon 894]|uniref:prepilin-type N-terminal cleavage/methylation domain-containing protein n=1 Tax=Ottowia sp. oral taxon 894 TaxID=1658672 RepID=UPI0006809C70|nr:prepilin-type N-terminal cleavage/methylation domain-containing protein [Ottowia sp. oral taxon 894]AKU66728.1 hypothetical protein ADJ79_04900 [Ottowia sp. oral taxon 894]
MTRQRGFTLMEVLIAMALLSLLMLALGSTLYSAAQTEERVDARVQSAEDLRLAARFLQEALSQASLRPVRQGNERLRPFFSGQAQAVEWVGVMPARYGLGGRHFMRLALERDVNGQGRLVLRYAPWSDEPGGIDWARAPWQALAQPVTGLSIRYRHPLSGEWVGDWAAAAGRRARIPSAVALDIRGPQPPWPLLIVPMRAPLASDTDARSEGFGP